jgi:glucosamine kinase
MALDLVIGLDGGGTTTRVAVADASGRVLGYAEAGGANPSHQADAEQSVQAAIRAALAAASCQPDQIAALAAGIAGLDSPADQEWADRFVAIPGLHGPRIAVNDTLIAQIGAFAGGPGVIVIAGTGSAIYAIDPAGRAFHNDDLQHYAGGARHLAFHAMHQILIGRASAADHAYLAAILAHWQSPDIAHLRELVFRQRERDYNDVKRDYSAMAQIVTAYAETAPLAGACCDDAAIGLVTGIRLLGGCFTEAVIPVALIGALARAAPIQRRVARQLASSTVHQYRLADPVLPPVAGAILLALRQIGVAPNPVLVNQLRSYWYV